MICEKDGGCDITIDGVIGVIIWTDNLDGMVEFYRDTLGLTPHSIRLNFVAFKWGEMRLSIGTHEEVSGQTSEPYRIMVNLGVDEIQKVHGILVSRGVRFDRDPEQEHWGGRVATFRDPDGNMLQLLEQPPD